MKVGKTLQELAIEIERQHKSKKDFLAPTEQLEMTANAELHIKGQGDFELSDIAHQQLAEHVDIPKRYYETMQREEPALLATNVQRWFEKYPAVRMVRTLDGKARAFLSDKFQPYDNFDFASATLPILKQRQLSVVSCEITDKRLYIKAIDEQLFRDVPVGYKMGDGSHQMFDTCAPAVILSNSEIGFGRLTLDVGVYTKVCTNLAMFANAGFKRTHLGARNRLLENMEVQDFDTILSSATKRKTMEATWLQVRDVINAAFNEDVFKKRCERLTAAATNKITKPANEVIELVADKFGFNETEQDSILQHLIEGGRLDQYGLHAAVTRASQQVDNYDRATDMEYAGGKIIELSRSDWSQLAEAA